MSLLKKKSVKVRRKKKKEFRVIVDSAKSLARKKKWKKKETTRQNRAKKIKKIAELPAYDIFSEFAASLEHNSPSGKPFTWLQKFELCWKQLIRLKQTFGFNHAPKKSLRTDEMRKKKQHKKAFMSALAEVERGFDFANGDYYRVQGHEGLWETKEVSFNHPECKLPENKGKARVVWKTKTKSGENEVTFEPVENVISFYRED